MHDLGKALTPADKWPSHHDHETLGVEALNILVQRLRVPNNFQKLALQVMQYHTHCHRAFEIRPSTLCDMLARIGAFKADNRVNDFLLACEADARGRLGFEDKPYPQSDYIRAAQKAAQKIDRSAISNDNIQGKEIGLAIHQLRIKEISKIKQCFT